MWHSGRFASAEPESYEPDKSRDFRESYEPDESRDFRDSYEPDESREPD